MALNKDVEAFIEYITFLLIIVIYQTKKTQIALLIIKKVKIPTKYLNFLDIFLEKKALVLLKTTNLN